MADSVEIGVISDTHGLLRAEALDALTGSDHIIHAGDVGDAVILGRLREIAPVTVVRGNVDTGAWAREIPYTASFTLGDTQLYVIHILQDLKIDPAAEGMAAVIYGHSHKPSIEHRNGVLYINPGSAGPRRFNLPITIARLTLQDGKLDARLVTL